MICIWSSCCHCHSVDTCFIRIQIGLTLLVPTYQVVQEKKRVSVCLIVSCGPETCGGIGCQPFADASQYEQVTHICFSLVTGTVGKFLVCGKVVTV